MSIKNITICIVKNDNKLYNVITKEQEVKNNMDQERKTVYRTIAVSCKVKDLLDEIAAAYALNKGKFVEKLIKEEYEKMMGSK